MKRSTSIILFAMSLAGGFAFFPACGGDPADDSEPAGVSPFSIAVVIPGTSVDGATRMLADYIQETDDTRRGLPDDWRVAGAGQLDAGADVMDATLKLPGGTRIVEVCNHHYASQAMSFGAHHGVGLPCEIALSQNKDDVEVVLLNPEGIFAAFFAQPETQRQFRDGYLFAFVQQEQTAVWFVDAVEHPHQDFDALCQQQPQMLLGMLRASRFLGGHLVERQVVGGVVLAATPQAGAGGGHDPVEPGGQGGIAAVPGQVLEGDAHRLMEGVFGQGRVAAAVVGGTQHFGGKARHDLFAEGGVGRGRAQDLGEVGTASAVGRRHGCHFSSEARIRAS